MDIACIISAVLFWISGGFRAAQMMQWRRQPNFNYILWTDFDAEYLIQQWNFRIDHRSFEMATGMINAIAWFTFAIPMLHVVWLQSLKGRRMISIHVAIALMAIGGAVTELLARLFYIGSTSTMEWMVKDFQLENWTENAEGDQLGWKSLEVTHLAIMGVLTWIDALEYLFLSFIFAFLFVSVWRKSERLLDVKWARFGMVLSALSLIDFAADLMRYQNWRKYSRITFVISALNRLVLFPIWLLWLAIQIPKAEAILGEASQPTEETKKFSSNLNEDNSHVVS
ncbi:hypothetical protein FisN_2Hh316 [Fistulifera solaris]|uniref:EXPERA domain-containing protein n=1 Tax=Fistulifera solaris TaxID=1519565 RepID=A0A1Z5KKT1_FISSO|nr:hypothetical protein FisN_2Hh316 [Fistulifera solaris]|eukprot:GAX26735.1 hypothetical protein FisN_2Hh316 [Fistulifera solaris]